MMFGGLFSIFCNKNLGILPNISKMMKLFRHKMLFLADNTWGRLRAHSNFRIYQ